MTDLYTSHYISNLTKFNWFVPQDDGSFLLNSPCPDDGLLINYDPEQTGGWVQTILSDPRKYMSGSSPAAAQDLRNVQGAAWTPVRKS